MAIVFFSTGGPWWLPFLMLFGLPMINGGLGFLFHVVLYLFGIDLLSEQPSSSASARTTPGSEQPTRRPVEPVAEDYFVDTPDIIRGVFFTVAGFLFFRAAMLLHRGGRISEAARQFFRIPSVIRRAADADAQRSRQAPRPPPRVTVDEVIKALQELPTELHATEDELLRMSVHELKDRLQARGIDCTHFLEKRELLDHMQCGGSSATTCSICCEDFESGEPVRVLRCQHRFHIDCGDKWLLSCTDYTRPPACPLCNTELIPPAKRRSLDSPATSTA